MPVSLLLIEDDVRLQELLQEYLAPFGCETRAVGDGAAGLAALDARKPDLVILDVMLPGMNGFEVCRAIRKRSSVPIIMLTARGDVMDRVAGLEIGADDYLSKPFEPRELVARIQTVLRRMGAGSKQAQQARFGRLRVDYDGREAFLDGKNLGLTTNEFNALAFLTRSPGKALDRDALMQELRGLESDSFNRSVDITMSRLRQKLGDDPKAPEFIKTVWGEGYLFMLREEGDAS
jgi:DNA-binding response OmpR family regulator